MKLPCKESLIGEFSLSRLRYAYKTFFITLLNEGFPTFAGFRSFFLPTMIDTPASFFTFLGKNTFVLVSDVLIKYCFCVMMTAMDKKSGLQKQETELNLPTPPLDLRHVFRKIVFFLFRQRRSVSFIS